MKSLRFIIDNKEYTVNFNIIKEAIEANERAIAVNSNDISNVMTIKRGTAAAVDNVDVDDLVLDESGDDLYVKYSDGTYKSVGLV